MPFGECRLARETPSSSLSLGPNPIRQATLDPASSSHAVWSHPSGILRKNISNYKTIDVKIRRVRTFLAVQGLRLCASKAGGAGSIPGRETRIPHAQRCGQKKEEK